MRILISPVNTAPSTHKNYTLQIEVPVFSPHFGEYCTRSSHVTLVYCAQHTDNAEPEQSHVIPRVERPDALLLADPEQSVEHAPVAHLRVLGLTLDL